MTKVFMIVLLVAGGHSSHRFAAEFPDMAACERAIEKGSKYIFPQGGDAEGLMATQCIYAAVSPDDNDIKGIPIMRGTGVEK